MLSWLRHKASPKHPYARPLGENLMVCPEFDDIEGTLALVFEGIRAEGLYRPSDLELPAFDNGLKFWIDGPAHIDPVSGKPYRPPYRPKPSNEDKAKAERERWLKRDAELSKKRRAERMQDPRQRPGLVTELFTMGKNISDIDADLGLESGTALKILREIRGD